MKKTVGRSTIGRTWKLAAFATVGLLGLVTAASATKFSIPLGNILIKGDVGFAPTSLPRDHDAPISLYGDASFSTVDHSLPPQVRTFSFDFDKHGSVQTEGLPTCKRQKLTNTTVDQARSACPKAIVGKGLGKAIIQFPGGPRLPVSSPITLFNGPPRNGQATIIGHAYTTVPVPTTIIIDAVIERIHEGRYGYRVTAHIPDLAGGNGTGTYGRIKVGRRWTDRGVRHSYINARCADGHLQSRVKIDFADGTVGRTVFALPCKASG